MSQSMHFQSCEELNKYRPHRDQLTRIYQSLIHLENIVVVPE